MAKIDQAKLIMAKLNQAKLFMAKIIYNIFIMAILNQAKTKKWLN